MGVARIDLADAASPERLVIEILKCETQLPIPVPIEQLCAQLDIVEIKPLTTPAFEGALLTDTDKHSGIILYNQASQPKRRRFTIAHELCHFLAPSHVPNTEGRFLCSQADMLLLAANEQDRRRRMEVEANRFASLICYRRRSSPEKLANPATQTWNTSSRFPTNTKLAWKRSGGPTLTIAAIAWRS